MVLPGVSNGKAFSSSPGRTAPPPSAGSSVTPRLSRVLPGWGGAFWELALCALVTASPPVTCDSTPRRDPDRVPRPPQLTVTVSNSGTHYLLTLKCSPFSPDNLVPCFPGRTVPARKELLLLFPPNPHLQPFTRSSPAPARLSAQLPPPPPRGLPEPLSTPDTRRGRCDACTHSPLSPRREPVSSLPRNRNCTDGKLRRKNPASRIEGSLVLHPRTYNELRVPFLKLCII